MKIAITLFTLFAALLTAGCAAQAGYESDEKSSDEGSAGTQAPAEATGVVAQAYERHACWRDCMGDGPDSMGAFCSCACGFRCTKALP